MAVTPSESKPELEGTRCEEDDHSDAVSDEYLQKRSLLLYFLHYHFDTQELQHHRDNIEQLKRCYFYLEVRPRQVIVRDRIQRLHCIDIFQLINSFQLLRMKKVAQTQVEVQLSLLSALLNHLEQGQEELTTYVMTCDKATFLSQWDLIKQRVSKLLEFKMKLFSLRKPGKLHMKHRLIFQQEADSLGIPVPTIKLSLSSKQPLIFDRKESFAHKTWAKVKWFDGQEESQPKQYELHVKLLTSGSPADMEYRSTHLVSSNVCVLENLQPDRSYEFKVRRSGTLMLIFPKRHDTIILKTSSKAVEDANGKIYGCEG